MARRQRSLAAEKGWQNRRRINRMSAEELAVSEILKPYLAQINGTPALISLLYCSGMMPEVSAQGAIRVATVVEAYNAGVLSVQGGETKP